MSESNGYMTREASLAPFQRSCIDVEAEGKFSIRNINERERSQMEAPNFTKKGEINIEKACDTKLRAIIAAVVTPGTTDPMYSLADLPALRQWSSTRVSRLYKAIATHCGLDQEGAESVEKNSEAVPASGSQ